MVRHFLTLLLAFLFIDVNADEVLRGREAHEVIPGTSVLRYRSFSSFPTFIKFQEGQRPNFSTWESWMSDRFFKESNGNGFTLVDTENDRLGMVHYKYQQTYQGVAMAFSYWNVHTLNGEVVSMNGHLYEFDGTSTPSLSEAQALDLALNQIDAEVYMWEVAEEEQALQVIEQDPNATYFPSGKLTWVANDPYDKEATLAWHFNIYASEPMSRRDIYIDASQGSVVFEQDLIHHVDSNCQAITGYSGQQGIVADFTGTNFRLREYSRGNGIFTYDLNNATGGLGSDFIHSDNLWDTTTVERFGTDAHWGAEMTYDYFYNHFNRNSINNNGFALISRVHYGTNYANAFWNGSFMTYGDGNSGNAPFTAVDIAGHEIAHGLTTFTAGLIYSYESGALNESFSDIFGAAVEFDAVGFSNGDWLIGEDLGFVIRSMSNPNAYGDPDTYLGTNWHYGPSDNGGVHTNSGVQNYWFYLLTEGGSGTNDIGNSFSVTGIGVNDAAAVAYRNLVIYLGPSSDYEDARFYALESALDLFGPCSQQLISTGNAWYAVGVGTPYEDDITADFIPSSTGNCSVPHTVQFQNISSNATSQFWFFGDGGSTAQFSPSRTYTTAGSYTVTLAVSSTCGTDTLVMPDLIQVGPNAPCEVTMPSNGQNSTFTDCEGVLYDNGGATGNYADDIDSYVTLTTQGAASMTLHFDDFSVEPGGGSNCIYDYLEVYDGDNLNAAVLGRFCNSNPPPSNLVSSGDAVTIRFSSDGAVNYSGFRIAWECNEPTSPPQAALMADVIQTCNGTVQFSDLSTNGTTSWTWNFGDGNSSSAQNPVHTYSESGLYTVTLIATNAIGSDTIVEPAYIQVNLPEPPTGEDDEICPGDFGMLVASSLGEHRWYASPFGGSIIHEGDTLFTPIVQQSTPFYVESLVKSSAKGVGPEDKDFGNGGYLASPGSMYFDALSKVVLHSVKVFANSGGSRHIILKDNNGNVLDDTITAVSSGEQVIILDFEIEAGNDYELAIGTNNTINLYRNTSGVNYPYDLNGVLSITSASGSSPTSTYFYFYDWQVEEVCVSERAVISASTGVCTGIDEVLAGDVSIFPNPAQNVVYVQWNEAIVESIQLINMDGRVIGDHRNLKGQRRLDINVGEVSRGVYLIQLQSEHGSSMQRLILQ